MSEIWKIIPDTNGYYMVSSKGRIASKYKTGYIPKEAYKGAPNGYRILNCRKDKHGYMLVDLHVNKKIKTELVHRLVMRMFVGDSDLQVNHINEIKFDNRLENLEYVTNRENARHSFQKPVERYDLETGKTRARYVSLTAAAEDGYNIGNINSACTGRYKQHGGYGWRYC